MDAEWAGKLVNFIPAALLAVACIILYDGALGRSVLYVFSYIIGSFGFVSFVSLHGMYQIYTSMYGDPYIVLNWGLISSDIWVFGQIWAGRLKREGKEFPETQLDRFWKIFFLLLCAVTILGICGVLV